MATPRNGHLLDTLFAQVRREGARRTGLVEASERSGVVRALLMPKQALLEADQSRRVAVRSARRAGKSTGMLYIVTVRCLEHPGSRWVIVCLTRTSSATRDYWTSLQVLNESFELGIRFNHQALTATFANGATVRFVGADNPAEIEKLRGSQYDGVVIDECKSFDELVFEELIQDVIEPALMDRSGTLYVIGTPGDNLRGPFYLATSEQEIRYKAPDGSDRRWNAPYGGPPGLPALWSLHQWTLQDNVTRFTNKRTGASYTLWDKALEVKADRGWTDDHPTWRREYLGHWVSADTKFVYRYRPHVHDYVPNGKGPHGLPGEKQDVWKRVIGFDFGTRDGTAMVVWAYSDTRPGLWELYSEKRTAEPGQKLPVRAIAEWYREVETEYGPFEAWPADWAGLATMVMDTLADEHGVYLEKAEKKEKLDHIQLFNSDLDSGHIHYRKHSPLSEETAGNRWDLKKLSAGKRVEDPNTPNDLCDAALYAFRWCRHRQAKDPDVDPQPGSPEWWGRVTAAEMKAARESARPRKDGDLDKEWWNER